MEICEFYKIKTLRYEKQNVSVDIPHCTHKKADKLSIEFLSKILGSAYVLKCKGDTFKCQLPKP